MNEKEFLRQQQAAVERMREMNARSAFGTQKPHQMPPVPSFVKVNEGKIGKGNPTGGFTAPNEKAFAETTQKNTSAQGNSYNSHHNSNGMGLPFLDNILSDSDTTLIIGLLLLLMSENADKRLLFALVYILL